MKHLYDLTSCRGTYFVPGLAFGQNVGAKHIKHLTDCSLTVDSILVAREIVLIYYAVVTIDSLLVSPNLNS